MKMTTIFILLSFILVSCATQQKSIKNDPVKIEKSNSLDYTTSIESSETNKDFELLVRDIMNNKELNIDQKTLLLENVKNKINRLSQKKDYINTKLKVDAKLTVETQTRIGELSGVVKNTGKKVITQMNVIVDSSDKKLKDTFPMKLTLTASDKDYNNFEFKNIISNVPQDWNKELTITVEDASFLK